MGNIAPKITRIGTEQAPVMADFSSRGPSFITPEILKVTYDDLILCFFCNFSKISMLRN
jgi:hypothetical protein